MGTDEEKTPCDTPTGPSAPQSPHDSTPEPSDAEAQPQQIDIEALGRQRPPIFKTLWAELGFCISLVASMLMAVCKPHSGYLLATLH